MSSSNEIDDGKFWLLVCQMLIITRQLMIVCWKFNEGYSDSENESPRCHSMEGQNNYLKYTGIIIWQEV